MNTMLEGEPLKLPPQLERNIANAHARLRVCEPQTKRELYLTPRLRIVGLYPDAETIPPGSEFLGVFTRTIGLEDFRHAVGAADRAKLAKDAE